MDAHKIFPGVSKLGGPETKVIRGPGMESGGKAPRSRRQIVKIMHI